MNAREKLLSFIKDNEPDHGNVMGFDEELGLLWGEKYAERASALIDKYAHELAEKIRVAFDGDMNEAAALIDPEAP